MKKIIIMCMFLATEFAIYAVMGRVEGPTIRTNENIPSDQFAEGPSVSFKSAFAEIGSPDKATINVIAEKGNSPTQPLKFKTTGVTFDKKEKPLTANEGGVDFGTGKDTEQIVHKGHFGSATGTHFDLNSREAVTITDITTTVPDNPTATPAEQPLQSAEQLPAAPDVIPAPERSYSQAASNKINNAFSITGNTKRTTTDKDGNITVTTKDKNDNLLTSKTTNKSGQVIKTVMVNPVSKATITVTYKDPTGKDKSTTTIIEKPSDPNSPITELRDETGTLTSIKNKKGVEISIKDTSGKLIATKTTMTSLDKLVDINATPDKMFNETITTAQFQAAQKVQAALQSSDKVTINTENTSVKITGAPEEDVNAAYRTTRDFEKATRSTVHSGYNKLTSIISAAKRLGQTVTEYRTSFTQDLIQKQIDNHLGYDIKSGESKFVLSDDQHKFLTDLLVQDEKYAPLFDPTNPKYKTLSKIEKLNLLADMGDVAINAISEGIAEFHTEFKPDGTCISTTTSMNADGSKIKLSSSFDNSGNPTENSIAIDGTTYTTTVGKGWTGKTTTKITGTNIGEQGKELTSKDGAFLSQAWILNKSITTFKLATKITLSLPKLAVTNGIGMLVTSPLREIIVAIYIPTVKIASMIPAMHVTDKETGDFKQAMDPVSGEPLFKKDKYGNTLKDAKGNQISKLEVYTFTGYQFTGHDYNDSSVRWATFKLADLAMGDDGNSLSSKGLGYLIGSKGPLLATGKGSPVFTPTNPMAKFLAKLQGKTPEQAAQDAADLNASYATMIDPVMQGVLLPLKFLFPQSIGDQILSKSDLQPSESTSALDVLGRVLNPKQLISALK